MGFVHSIVLPIIARRRAALLLFSAVLSLLIGLFFSLGTSGRVDAQIPPLSPLTVATPGPQNQTPSSVAGTPSPLSPLYTDAIPLSPDQVPPTGANIVLQETPFQQPLAPLGTLSTAQPSLIMVGLLLAGLGLLVVVLLVARTQE